MQEGPDPGGTGPADGSTVPAVNNDGTGATSVALVDLSEEKHTR